MFICLRTRLNLDDHLMRQVRRQAADTGRTLTAVIEEALREQLARSGAARAKKFRLSWQTVSGKLKPGVDLSDRDSLYERMEGRA